MIDLLHKLFYKREDTLLVGFTEVMRLVYLKKPFRLEFGGEGVFAIVPEGEGLYRSVQIYSGEYTLENKNKGAKE